MRSLRAAVLLTVLVPTPAQSPLSELPPVTAPPSAARPHIDWLLDATPFRARLLRGAAAAPELVLDNGLLRRTFRLAPNLACVGFDDLVRGEALLRAVRPEATVTIDGVERAVGGLVGQPDHAWLEPAWLDGMTADPGALRFVGWSSGPIAPRLAWRRTRHAAPDAVWPPAGIEVRFDFAPPDGAPYRVAVHYALYDGLPALAKWLTIDNLGTAPIVVDRFRSEELAIVEHDNPVEARPEVPLQHPQHLHVETDFAFGGFNFENANRHVVHWRVDPQYTTQVNYLRQQPCLLVVEPSRGPAQWIAPGGTFTTYRTFELCHDSLERERTSLGLRRLYRTVAPWVTENPLMMHMRSADPTLVRAAIDQCAEVGFEMLILSFGSGFDIENEDPARLALWRGLADHARERGVEIGGYSLLSSRQIGGGNDVVSPPGESPTHGSCPALTSPWGQDYFRKLYAFFPATGFTLLEHDGPYPGDVDVTPRPPLQTGPLDSRWVQWRIAADFYGWCRAQGIYVNAPDHYFLNGTSKTGMGYREVNWSLPRDWQVLHTRQNIYDGTWRKPPSLGWMFVPLTEYHGGGAAATIEPLDEHLDHYDRMLVANLGFGVQACYRGPRLYDTPRVRDQVRARVDWFLRYRDILESDLVHGRRADGRDVDWMLHVNPRLPELGMLVVHNPLPAAVTRELSVDLYYTGLTGRASIAVEDAAPRDVPLDPRGRADVELTVPARGFTWAVIRAAAPR
ncbi:MAG: alpha-galactosidase [Planctomycetes bacterium]|nr:alpha-galactosidase [Planctomycetota bacterium]